MTRLAIWTVGDERRASTRYRALAYRPLLEAAGYRVDVRHALGIGARTRIARRLARAADLLRDVATPPAADLLFVQRKLFPPWAARALRREGRPLLYDLDDAVDLPPPGREAGSRTRRRYRRNFEATTAAADLVLCGNRELAERLPHARHEILPTPIDTERFAPGAVEPAGDEPVLGWVGHSDNLPYLEALAGALGELSRRHPRLRLVVVADRAPALPGLRVEFRRWSLESELSCFGGIAVGLMPLADTPWARAKCAFKAIQYMALGLPTVASPVGMNREVIRHGASGFLADGEREWVEAIDALLRDPALARAVGAAARADVVARYSLAAAARRLLEILGGLLRPGRCGRGGGVG